MTTTTHLGITLVEQSQAQKEVTVNTALTRIDAMLNNSAKSRTTSTPPGSPASGDLYIVGTSPTGAWAGQAGNLAYFDQVWQFVAPGAGMSLWVADESLIYTYNGSAWTITSRPMGQAPVALTDAATISWNLVTAPFATVTLAGNRTLANPSTLMPGNAYMLIVKQDGTGSRTLAYGSTFKWPSGSAPVLSTAAGAIDMLSFACDGTNVYGSIQKGFA
ncbi:MAG: DUF2793 domain-containing protein [Pseudomonadota bacterium]|nr:DUF2793 domain-containing protein [Pseudomonadota bacterium]